MTSPKYKLAHVDIKQITSAARKALIAADTQYHAWPSVKQERFRATMNEDARKRVQCVLTEALLGIKCTTAEIDEAWNNIPATKLNIINWAKLLTEGIGDDYIYLNECMAKDKSLLDFNTLHDYDYNDYLFQEQSISKDSPSYKGQDYYAYKHPSWVRLLTSDQFYYATFLSVATYLTDEIESAGSDHIRQLIPHDYVDGKDNGKPEKGGFLLDLKVNAAGLEGQLDELKSRWHPYLQQRWLELSKKYDNLAPAVYTLDMDWDADPHRFFIFNNAATLKKIRWRHFISDCEPLLTDFSAVEKQRKEEIEGAITWLSENHRDVMGNFDPDVIPFRKKMKVVLSSGALEDMARIESEDDPCQ